MKIVEIEWEDSCGVHSVWESNDVDSLPPMSITSVGYLWEKTKTHITICQSLSREQAPAHRFTIPLGCVKKIRTIRR